MADSKHFEEAWAVVKTLSGQFVKNQHHYLSPTYQEAEVRKDFIDKFFKALGWDVDHERELDPWRQEVKIEKAERKSKGRADYAFSLAPHYRRVRFFVEAKRPQVNIATTENAFQAIRCSWPKGVPVSVLTDFNSLHIIDSRYRPNINTATSRIVRTWHHSDYTDRNKFAEIYWLLSREGIASGSIENFAENILPTPQTAVKQYTLFAGEARAFDDDFLDKLDEWRESLAAVFKKFRTDLTGEQLTECVQRALDRLVFIRFLEDKFIEPDRIIDRFGSRGRTHWHDFIQGCKRLDHKYNGVVFKEHSILDSTDFEPQGSTFADICDELTDEHSPYNFDSIPVEILGRIYERFLGKIVLAHRRSVEVVEKPDVRKAGGVYYTPDYIVAYMVEHALEPQVKGKHPDDILRLRIVDTACGSGSFLIGAFAYLLHAVLNHWQQKPKAAKKGMLYERDNEWHLSLKYRRQILVNCIHGVDIDAQAVEVAQLSLYLKLMEDETTTTALEQQYEIGAALLPSLASNIVVGNSLISPKGGRHDLFSIEQHADLKALNFHAAFPGAFKTGGFDLVIGNPPYIKEYTNREAFDHVRESPYFEGKMDIWYMFACIGLDLLKPESGRLAYIATNNWVTNAGAKKLRAKITSDAKIEQLIDFGDFMVFRDASIQTMILIVTKNSEPERYKFDYRRLTGSNPTLAQAHALLERASLPNCQYLTPIFDRARAPTAPLTFSASGIEVLLDKVASKRNFSLDGSLEIAQGIVPNPDVVSARSLELIPARRRQEQKIGVGDGVFVVSAGVFNSPTKAEKHFLKPLFEPIDVDRYAITRQSSKEIIYATRANTEQTQLPARLMHHLARYREIMEERRENQLGRIDFYQLHWPRDERFFVEGPKILAVRKCERPTFAYCEHEAYVMMAFNVIRTSRVDMLFLTGLLNSRLVHFWLRHRGKMQGQNFQIDKEPLLALPLHVPTDAIQKRIAELVEQIVTLRKKIAASAITDAERTQLQRLARQIDAKVQEEIETLYGLNSSESALIEETCQADVVAA